MKDACFFTAQGPQSLGVDIEILQPPDKGFQDEPALLWLRLLLRHPSTFSFLLPTNLEGTRSPPQKLRQ